MGDGVSLPIPPQLGCDECILTHITLYLNHKRGKRRAKLVGSSWYLTPLLWDTPYLDNHIASMHLAAPCCYDITARCRRVSKQRMVPRSRRALAVRRPLRRRSDRDDQQTSRALQRASRLLPWPKEVTEEELDDSEAEPLYDDTLDQDAVATVPDAYHRLKKEWLAHSTIACTDDEPPLDLQKAVIDQRP